jgi:hypothetical protein
VPVRRVKRTLRHLDPFSVLKLSLFFYMAALVVWLVFVALVYSIIDGAGWFTLIEDLGGPDGFALWRTFDFSLVTIERWAFLIGLTLAILGSILNSVLAILYNIAADILGGVEMTFVEREL